MKICGLVLGQSASVVYPTATHIGAIVRHSPFSLVCFDENTTSFFRNGTQTSLESIRARRSKKRSRGRVTFNLADLLSQGRRHAKCSCISLEPENRRCCAAMQAFVSSQIFGM
jgi:hypothetical protein